MKLTRKEKEERAKRFNISIATYYNWEKEKPELIKIIDLGLEKEKELENGSNQNNEIMNLEIGNIIRDALNEISLERKNKLNEDNNRINEMLENINEKQEKIEKMLEKIKNDKK